MKEYLMLVQKAQKKRISLTKKQIKNTRGLYREVAKDLEKRAGRANKGSLSERWLLDYQKQFKKGIKELNEILKKDIEKSMLESAEYANNIQTDFFNLLDIKYSLNSKETFSNMFSMIPQGTLEELINGEFYKDGKGLSRRLWFHEMKVNSDFDYIIQRGLAEKKSVYDLAKDLSNYVNPDVKKDWNFKRIYPRVGNKKIEYNSFRLAVTSISHAYQLSMQRSCKANPFVEGIEWHTSNSHREPCSICREREGKIYKPDELPLDHPNGVCYFTPVITKSLDEVGTELHDWLYGESNNRLDDWYKEYDNYGKTYTNNVSNVGNSGIIKQRSISERNMANGNRKSYKIKLSDDDKNHLLNEIKLIKADKSIFIFRDGFGSGYLDEGDRIFISSNIYPSNDGSMHPRDLMSERAALAHEYYGHRANRGTTLNHGSWNDEFRASYMAAKNCPNLSDEDRMYLILDSIERAKEAGVSIEYNSFMRRILYGY